MNKNIPENQKNVKTFGVSKAKTQRNEGEKKFDDDIDQDFEKVTGDKREHH